MNREVLTDEELKVLARPAAKEPVANTVPASPPSTPADEHRVLTELHDGFSSILTEILSRMGLRDVRCRLREAMLGTYGQFVFAQTIPTCCAVVGAERSRLEFYLALQPTVLYPVIDALMGVNSAEPPPQRPMTEIESEIAARIMNQILAGYTQILQRTSSLELKVDRLEHNPQRLRGIPGGERIYMVTFDVQCRSDYGRLTICLPWSYAEQIRDRLLADR